jgi:NAD(P)-dependent dehydrogenase (short-subunit alcohol dehydrogenase family)
MPGKNALMDPPPDYGEEGYRGAARFAREGADILVSYYNEHEDAKETQRLVESAGRRCLLVNGDIKDAGHCRDLIALAAQAIRGDRRGNRRKADLVKAAFHEA